MAEEKNADRSSIEIKTMLRKLHPDRGNHKDRIRRLNRFRTYVTVTGKGGVPEFYDDDIPLLFLGAACPPSYLDDPNDVDSLSGLYGLLQACGTPSGEHDGTLKRSARQSMNLLKWLLLDWRDSNQKKDDMNVFARSFLTFAPQHYHHMGLDFHCDDRKGDRGGAKEDACQVIVLILTKHLSEDGENEAPLMMEDLMSRPIAQQEFEIWLANNTTSTVQDIIKKHAASRQAELALQQRQDLLANKALGGLNEDYEEDSDQDNSEGADDSDNADDGVEMNDAMAAIRKRQKSLRKELKEAEARGEITKNQGVATRWEDSQLAREQRAWAASAARAGEHQTVRDSQDAAQEAAEREEEKAKLMGKDPLGIVSNDEEFDLLKIEKAMAEHMEQALHDIQEEIQKAESTGSEEYVRKVAAQKESLEALIERLGGLDAMEHSSNLMFSITPSSSKFDPILFLTLVHRKTSYERLMGSMGRLSSKTENQAEQLQNLVRENFPLFVRCAEGFEEFRRSFETAQGMGINERIDKLEAIAESCAFQAKKSFKPLLDNTSEVRKVQSAMAVLQRVSPILQVPALMRQHIENRRYSQALKTFRRVLVIGETCNITLLNHVKKQAEQCVRDARRDLELRIAQDVSVSLDDLMEGLRDLGELLELDVPNVPLVGENVDKTLEGIFEIGGATVRVRDHPPALSCLLLQTAHLSQGVKYLITSADESCNRIFSGENFSQTAVDATSDAVDTKSNKGSGNQWKYDVLDARVLSTMKAISMARVWLPRLVAVALVAKEDEKRRAARVGARKKQDDSHLTSFDVFFSNISPVLKLLVEHATFCAVGSNTRSGARDVRMTFGQNAPEKLHALLRSPLPPSQSTKVGKELADLVELLAESSGGARSLLPVSRSSISGQISLLEDCRVLAESAVVTIEKRRCIYAFDVCARASSNRASGSGKFDTDALLQCLHNLSEQLSRADHCASEVEKGCELVIRRCCEGLASYVRDRGDASRLTAVSECADVLHEKISDISQAASLLTPHSASVRQVMMEEVLSLETAMFDEFLDNIRQTVASSVRVGWLDKEADAISNDGIEMPPSFPAYLSASLLAIVRCRAQVEHALGDKVRASDDVKYQHLAMTTVADGVVEGVCNEITKRKLKLKVRQADRLANELEFLRSTLRKFLGEEASSLLESTLQIVNTKAGRGREYQGNGPDGLAAIEELERLGRVYVLCLGD